MVSPASCAKVANEGTLEMSLNNQGGDTSVKRSLDEDSHEEVLDKMQVLEEVLDGGSTNEDVPPCDAEYIVAFYIHAIGIPEMQLTQNRLEQVGY